MGHTSSINDRYARLLLVLCLGLAGLGGGNASAQPLIRLAPLSDTPRSHAPVQFAASVRWDQDRILSGYLQLDYYVAEQKVHSWTSRELALSNSDITLPVLAPPVILKMERDTLEIDPKFITEEKTYTYEDELNVQYWVDWKRVFVMGIVHPSENVLTERDFLVGTADSSWIGKFRFDDELPDPALSQHIVCRTEQISPDRFPDSPLELTAFDTLVITNEGLNELSREQLEIVAAWNEAGGAVCVAGYRCRSPEQQEFLNRILDTQADNPLFTFDADGELTSLEASPNPWFVGHPGIGQSVVTTQPVDVTTDAWRNAVFDLWRLRHSQIEYAKTKKTWASPINDTNRTQFQFGEFRPYGVKPADTLKTEQILLPDRVEGVPFSTVATVLFLCLLAVGPGDYFFLGLIRKRRWTWLLFPSVALAFAWFTIDLAQSHMGKTDYIRTLDVLDLTRDGRCARKTTFELYFAATQKDVVTEAEDVIAVPIETRQPQQYDPYGQIRGMSLDSMVTRVEHPLAYQGRSPLKYTFARPVRQWEPQIVRYTRLASEESFPNFSWETVTPDLLRDEEARQKLTWQLEQTFPESLVLIDHGDPSEFEAKTKLEQVAKYAINLNAQPPAGIFHLMSQMSPNAAGNYEDLTLLDRTDPNQWVVMVVAPTDNGYAIYRRLITDRR